MHVITEAYVFGTQEEN